jgi:hypothetical protein
LIQVNGTLPVMVYDAWWHRNAFYGIGSTVDRLGRKMLDGWCGWLRLALVVLFATWSVVSVVHAPAASAEDHDGLRIAASFGETGDDGTGHMNHPDCSARAHCASPAVLTAVLTIAVACEPDWTRSVQTILGALSAAPEIPPPNRLAA